VFLLNLFSTFAKLMQRGSFYSRLIYFATALTIRESAMAQRKYPVMSVEDYLILSRNSKDIRYEYLDGDVCMLAGGSPDHSIIIANLTASIKGPLKGGQLPCLQFRGPTQAFRKAQRLPRYHGQLR
jgi:hypothetical protein